MINSLGKSTDWVFNIIFVNHEYMINLEQRYFQKNETTDVISFNLSDAMSFPEGEIYINVQQAQEQSNDYNITLENELVRLLVHGILHLFGYNDICQTDRKKMKRLEDQFVTEFFSRQLIT
jgi:rRNA maturation RNase YbeY